MDEPQAPLTEREQFERWARTIGGNIFRHEYNPERYANATVQGWWKAWQARAALASAPHPPSNTLLKPGGCQLHNLHCGWPACNEPDDEPEADTGNPEADRIINRLMSSDPDFDDCVAAARLIRALATPATRPGTAAQQTGASHE